MKQVIIISWQCVAHLVWAGLAVPVVDAEAALFPATLAAFEAAHLLQHGEAAGRALVTVVDLAAVTIATVALAAAAVGAGALLDLGQGDLQPG